MPHLCRALCERKPVIIIIACSTNYIFSRDIADKPLSEEDIIAELRKLFVMLGTEYPKIKAVFSTLLIWTDKGNEGVEKITQVNSLFQWCNLLHITHKNITERHLNGSSYIWISRALQFWKKIVEYLELYDKNWFFRSKIKNHWMLRYPIRKWKRFQIIFRWDWSRKW